MTAEREMNEQIAEQVRVNRGEYLSEKPRYPETFVDHGGECASISAMPMKKVKEESKKANASFRSAVLELVLMGFASSALILLVAYAGWTIVSLLGGV